MVAQTVVMGIMFYEYMLAACVSVCCYLTCAVIILQNRDSRHRGSGTSDPQATSLRWKAA